MKVLFVCHYNVGRSQMAKAFYNSLTSSQDADSAGTQVYEPGQTLIDRKKTSSSKHFYVIDVMNLAGIDISLYKRQPITEKMLDQYDYIISMAEKEVSPDWLVSAPNYIYWDVPDPKGQNLEITLKSRDEIKSRVEDFIKQKETSNHLH